MMSVTDPVVEKSSSKCEVKDEDELRISNTEVPSNDESPGLVQPEASVSDDNILEIFSDTTFSNEYKTCGDGDSLPEPHQKFEDNLDLNSDSQSATILAIDEFRSNFTKSLQSFSVLGKETKNSFPNFPLEKFQNESPSLADKSTPSPLLLFASQEGSPFESPSSSFNLIGNKSPSSAVCQTFDLPLPGQNADDVSSPKPDCVKKSPNSDSSLKVSFDSPLNITLSKSEMDLDSCETSVEQADNSTDGKTLTPVMDVSDMDLGLDTTEKKTLDSSRYSPNRLDSDEENQDFTSAKPKVLGKEQAKKRLMAFSLSRQSGAPVVKKQNKLIVPQKGPKEKPPNPNKSVGVQEQFRATITAIEEEKKKMMQNMPDYLLMYTNSLANVGDGPVMNPAEKSIKDAELDINAITKMIMEKTEKDEVKSKGQSSPNKSRSSVSRSKRQEGREKRENDEKNDELQFKKLESVHCWKSFTELGFALDSVFWRLKFRFEEKQKQKDRNKRFWSPDYKPLCDYKPVFDYLTDCPPSMAPLKAKTQKPGQLACFKEKTVKFTVTKPVITWAENPRCATDFYMPKRMLLDNCDKTTSSILNDVMHQRGETTAEVKKPKKRKWYPKFDFLTEIQNVEDKNDTDEKCEIARKKDKKTKDNDEDDDGSDREKSGNLEWNRNGRETELNWELEQGDLSNEKDELGLEPKDFPVLKSRERRVNRNYPSDEEDNRPRKPVRELVVGDMKVQLDMGLNSVKVKSKWDSDYDDDDDDDDKDSWNGIEKLRGKRTSLDTHEEYDTKSLSANDAGNLGNPSDEKEYTSNQANSSVVDSQTSEFSVDGPKGKLASEYEKFMRLVSCDVDNVKDQNSSESQFEKLNKRSSAIRLLLSDNKNSKHIDPTDWDLESDREEKPDNIDSVKEGTADSFPMLLPGYDGKTRKKSKSPGKKKSGKYKTKDKSSKPGKNKKKKNKGKSSSESSSDSSDSGSDSDSSDSDEKRRKKKRKRSKKYRKRYSSSSSSSSTSSSSSSSSDSSSSDSKSDSDDKSSKSKKNRHKKKKKRVKKTVGGESSGSNDESGAAMLQQLDLKKQQLIKKIEEIDSLDGAKNKKKKISKAGKDEKFESEVGLKAGKRTGNAKSVGYFDGSHDSAKETEETQKIQKTLEKFGGTQSADEIVKEKRGRKRSRKEKWSSESSSQCEEKENRRTKSAKKLKRSRRKRAEYSSSSESDSSSDSRKPKYKKKKKKKGSEQKSFTKNTQEMPNWNDHLLSDESDCKSQSAEVGRNLSWLSNKRDRERSKRDATDKLQKDPEGLKDLGDWENSSVEESLKDRQSRESTWDEELPVPGVGQLPKDDTKKEKEKSAAGEELIHGDRNNFINEFDLESNRDLFTESGDINLDPKASRDSYARENSSSMQLFRSITGKNSNLNTSRPMEETRRVVGNESRKEKDKPSQDELYSPGHTDSDMSVENDREEYCRESEGRPVRIKQEIHDPHDSGSEVTDKRDRAEANAVPRPPVSNILLSEDMRNQAEEERLVSGHSVDSSLPKSEFIAIPLAKENEGNKNIPSVSERAIVLDFSKKKSMYNVKLQQKLQSKVASVFQSDSEDEVEVARKDKTSNAESEAAPKGKTLTEEESSRKDTNKEDKKLSEEGSYNERSRRRSKDRTHRSRWGSDSHRENSERHSSSRRRSPSADPNSEKWNPDEEDSRKRKGVDRRSPRSKTDSNSEIGLRKSDEVTEKENENEADVVRPIPVLTGLDVRMSDGFPWNRSHMLGSEDIGFSCDHLDLMSPNQDSYKIYGSPDGKSEAFLHDSRDRGSFGRKYERNYGHDGSDMDVLMENRMRVDKRKSRSRSGSPRKRRRSKSPDRRRSPRTRSPKRRSTSPRRRGRSPFSPRRRGSPRGRRYRTSRSPERKKSRSPRKGRPTPSRRSRSISPRKHKDRPDSPRRRSMSPGKDGYREIGVRNLIHLTGMPDDENRDLGSTKYDSPMGFTRSLADSTISDSELNTAFYTREYAGEYGSQNYPEDVTVNNLITVQNHDADKQTDSPKRLPLDQRLELELGVAAAQNDQYQMPSHQSYEQFPEHGNQYPNSYPCDDSIPHTSNGSQNFYPTPNSEFNGQYFNGQTGSSGFDQYQQYPCHNQSQPQNSVLQVGNIMEVVPSLQSQLPPPTMLPPSKGHQIMQVGNVLQVVPSPKPAQAAPFNYAATPAPANTQQPVPVHFDKKTTRELLMSNPIVRAIILEKERRKREKEKRKMERDARRKARQQRREAKMMSVNEKLKKSVQDEGLMLGQEVEEEGEDDAEHPSPPVPVEIVTDSSQSTLPPAGKGILITAGFVPRPASEKKEVKFADGVCPGEGTSASEAEDQAAPPPKPKLPKEKRYKKKKPKVKKKVKVHIIKQVVQDEEEEEDPLPPPPPPPGDPPPGIFYVKFRNGKVQYPIYRKQTTTTTFTTVQFPPENMQ